MAAYEFVLTLMNGQQFVFENPPLNYPQVKPHLNKIEWISLRYKNRQYNVNVRESLFAIGETDENEFGYVDVRAVSNIRPLCGIVYKGDVAVNAAFGGGRSRQAEPMYIQIGYLGKDENGQWMRVYMKIFPSKRFYIQVERLVSK